MPDIYFSTTLSGKLLPPFKQLYLMTNSASTGSKWLHVMTEKFEH